MVISGLPRQTESRATATKGDRMTQATVAAKETNLDDASIQWRDRPGDERFLSVRDLHENVAARHAHSQEFTLSSRVLGDNVKHQGDDRLVLAGRTGNAVFSNFAFGQLSGIAGAPAGYLRSLPAPITAVNLAWGLANRANDSTKVLALPPNGRDGMVRAFTSETYGRIWDDQVTAALLELEERTNGQWKVPAASYASKDPKRATTLYASDRDVWVMLVDDSHPIDFGNGDVLFKGFMVWNSEVGDSTFGLRTFYYRYVCDNRIVWGARVQSELKIRHTSGGPARFAIQVAPALKEYSEESPAEIIEHISAAKRYAIPEAEKPQDVVAWLKNRGFGKEMAETAVTLAEHEEGEGSSLNLWGIAQGITAAARNVKYNDDRVRLEQQAGKILDMAVR